MNYNNHIPFQIKLSSINENAVVRGLTEHFFPEEVLKNMQETLSELLMDYMKNVYGYVPEANKAIQMNNVTYNIDNDSDNPAEWVSFNAPLFNLPFAQVWKNSLRIHSSDCPVPGLAETANIIKDWREKSSCLETSLGSELKICGTLKKFVEKFPNLKDVVMPFTGLAERENLPVMIDMDEIVL